MGDLSLLSLCTRGYRMGLVIGSASSRWTNSCEGAQALRDAGAAGLSVQTLMEMVEATGVKQWDDKRSGKVSVASTCAHDVAFCRLPNHRVALRALLPNAEVGHSPSTLVRGCCCGH